jgi:tetratricopeptide (TPR) repeat protein
MPEIDYNKVCFVIMPFNKKKVGDKDVDFDFIYEKVFKPAIESVDLPEGGKLQPRRTDKDYFSGDISQEMWQYIEYSRFALADISGLNANVFYELGVRHRAHESGTAIFRQEAGPPPFDINQIKAFPYEYEPEDKVSASVALISRVLAESLVMNRLDSPPMRALRAQREAERSPQQPNIEPLLIEADNALRKANEKADELLSEADKLLRVQLWTNALDKLTEALAASPDNVMVLMKRGIVYRDQGKFAEALADFARVIGMSPNYAEAHREKGIAENKLFTGELKKRKLQPTEESARALEAEGVTSGEASLRRATELKPDDFDALSGLGGVLKRQGRMREAAEAYEKATDISQGNTYPLLNAITVGANAAGRFELDGRHRLMLRKGVRSLQAQVAAGVNLPWSAFDLAQAYLYTGEPEKFLQYVDEGMISCTHKWQPATFRETLELLPASGVSLPGLEEGIANLKDADHLPD